MRPRRMAEDFHEIIEHSNVHFINNFRFSQQIYWITYLLLITRRLMLEEAERNSMFILFRFRWSALDDDGLWWRELRNQDLSVNAFRRDFMCGAV